MSPVLRDLQGFILNLGIVSHMPSHSTVGSQILHFDSSTADKKWMVLRWTSVGRTLAPSPNRQLADKTDRAGLSKALNESKGGGTVKTTWAHKVLLKKVSLVGLRIPLRLQGGGQCRQISPYHWDGCPFHMGILIGSKSWSWQGDMLGWACDNSHLVCQYS